MKKITICIALFMFSNLVLAKTERYSIERSEIRTFKSEDGKREYRLFIKTPRSYSSNTDESYPLVFLNDGPYAFPLVSSITRQMSFGGVIEEPIIVGISYDKKTSWDISRARDYTPTHSPNEKNGHSEKSKKYSGGASDYLQLFNEELLPYLRSEFRIDQRKEIYAGHSFGALWGGFVLKTKPETFDHYILSDPSIWYHNRSILDIKYQPSLREMNVIVFSQGKDKGDDCGSCMRKNAREFKKHLKQVIPKATIEYHEFEHEIHETIFPTAVSQGLKRILKKQKP